MPIQTWSHGSENDFNRHCSYSANVHMVILMKLSPDHKKRFTLMQLSGTWHPTCTIISYFVNTHTNNVHVTSLKN